MKNLDQLIGKVVRWGWLAAILLSALMFYAVGEGQTFGLAATAIVAWSIVLFGSAFLFWFLGDLTVALVKRGIDLIRR